MGKVVETYERNYKEEDQKLFRAIINLKEGDQDSFEQVYKLSEKYIYSIIYRIVRDNDKTADLMQETYIQIYNKLDTLDNVESFLVWAGRIATNKTLRYIQKYSKEVLLDEEETDFVFENVRDDKEEFLPEDILLNKEKKEKIYNIINNLSSEQKITIQYYYFHEMSVGEISKIMQCSPGTVKSRLNYARKQIKQAVIDTEKKEGIKLYSLSGLPLFWLLFREEAAACMVPEVISSSVIKGIGDTVGIKIVETVGNEIAKVGKKGLKELIHKFFDTTAGKIVSSVAVVSVAGTVAVSQIPKTLYTTTNTIIDVQKSSNEIQNPEDCHNQYLIDGKFIVLENDKDQRGVYTIKGKEILPSAFDKIEYNEYTGGLFRVSKDDMWAYYNKSGEIICDKMYDELGPVIDKMFWCYDEESDKYKVYSVDGYQVSDSSYDYIGEMANGLVVVKRDLKCGLLSIDGTLLFDIKYDDIFLGDGEYIVLNEELNDAYRRTVLDSSLNVVFTEDYDNKYMPLCFGSGFYNGVVELSGFQNLFTPIYVPTKVDGTWIFNPIDTDFLPYNFELYPNGYFSYYNDNLEKSVLFNTNGEEIAIADYSSFYYLDNKFILSDDRKYSLIDEKASVIISDYDMIWSHYKGKYYVCQEGNYYDLYKDDGTILYNDATYHIASIGSEMFKCESDSETIIVDGVSGKSFVLSPEESIISYFCDGYAIKYTCDDIIKIGEINYKYEIIDRKGKVVYTIDIPKEGGLD
ncbi:MAG: sigma-70 family RNA polymerase sigma factor, partial [Bacillota bacterium]|nr:sigma-70 family RNA polymerase sigma factor [Bacillota bacterium]